MARRGCCNRRARAAQGCRRLRTAGVFHAVGVGGGDDGEDAAGLCGNLDVSRVGEVVAVVSGSGDEDGSCLHGGIGDAVEGCFDACAVSGREIDGGAERHGDDVGVVGDGIVDALNNPAKESAGSASCAARSFVGAGDGQVGIRSRTLMLSRVAAGGDSDQAAGARAEGGSGQGGGPGAMAVLIARTAVVADARQDR